MRKPLLLEDVRKAYGSGSGRQRVLHGLSLRIGEGEFVVVHGPPGAGRRRC